MTSLISISVKLSNVNILALDKSGALISKEGFSVVAPIKTTVPSSTEGKITSCCALLNLCTSSIKRTVLILFNVNLSFASKIERLKSETPDSTALKESK